MKKILLVCGSGICTSTVVRSKVEAELDKRGLKGTYAITQGKASEVLNLSKNYDLVISTTMLSEKTCACPLIIGTQFLMGFGTDPIVDKIVAVLKD